MAVAFNAVSSAVTFSNATSASWTHTASGSDRVVYVCVAFFGFPSAQTISSVTYDGTDITASAFGSVNVDYGGYPLYVIWYELRNPPTTSNAAVVVTFSGAVYGVTGSVSLTGANQTTAHGTPVTNTGSLTATDPTATVTGTTSGNLVLGGVHVNSGGHTVTADLTNAWLGQERTGTGSWGGVERTDGGGDKTTSWTITSGLGTNTWAVSSFEVLAAAGGSGGVKCPLLRVG